MSAGAQRGTSDHGRRPGAMKDLGTITRGGAAWRMLQDTRTGMITLFEEGRLEEAGRTFGSLEDALLWAQQPKQLLLDISEH